MNASDILKYGNDFVLRNLADLPQDKWEVENVCGWWSTKNIVAHLASFEHVLNEILNSFVGSGPTPYLDQFSNHEGNFNDFQVGLRKDKTAQAVLEEYEARHAMNMALIGQIDAETLRRPGTLPWYGAEYALDDFIVYSFYGHKREHTAQVNVFKDTLK